MCFGNPLNFAYLVYDLYDFSVSSQSILVKMFFSLLFYLCFSLLFFPERKKIPPVLRSRQFSTAATGRIFLCLYYVYGVDFTLKPGCVFSVLLLMLPVL